ncbi:MAG TPA: dihydrofolate reductase family protein [Nocardioides sp.]|uniref:dihydrofolate reductase family protein n=1 Tax=Nocardioides sp. TaxID=35761 RepID=UPI002D7EBC25|nr:dihydrofolate reductase family protein [Nocardioides sp.]HET6652511.1 dihydrofolate reductase family protein [Nocardioides sp.]
MTRTQYYTATSIDGFIADADNSLSWLFEVKGDPTDRRVEWDSFIGAVGAMAMGATTYQWILDHERLLERPEQWQQMYADRPTWVFTHRDLPVIPDAPIRFCRDDVRTVHAEMVAAAGDRNVWLIGGGDLVGQFDDAGLLDEIHLGVQPVFLGSGAPLLPRRITSERLSLRSADRRGPQLSLVYDVAH